MLDFGESDVVEEMKVVSSASILAFPLNCSALSFHFLGSAPFNGNRFSWFMQHLAEMTSDEILQVSIQKEKKSSSLFSGRVDLLP